EATAFLPVPHYGTPGRCPASAPTARRARRTRPSARRTYSPPIRCSPAARPTACRSPGGGSGSAAGFFAANPAVGGSLGGAGPAGGGGVPTGVPPSEKGNPGELLFCF